MPTLIVWIPKQKGYCHLLLLTAENYTFGFQQKVCKSLTEIMIACSSNGCQVKRLFIPLPPTIRMMLFRKKKKQKSFALYRLYSPQAFLLLPPFSSSAPAKRDCIKEKGVSILKLLVRFPCALVGVYHSTNCPSSASYMIWYYFKFDIFSCFQSVIWSDSNAPAKTVERSLY